MSLVADYGSSDSERSKDDLSDTKLDSEEDSDEEMNELEINQRYKINILLFRQKK